MERDEIIKVSENPEKKSNIKLFEARDLLYKEFEHTKKLIIDLTKHMDAVEEYYKAITKEIEKRQR